MSVGGTPADIRHLKSAQWSISRRHDTTLHLSQEGSDLEGTGMIGRLRQWGWIVVALALAAPMVGAQESAKPERKPQSAVAAKDKAFATVAADSAEVKAAKKAD